MLVDVGSLRVAAVFRAVGQALREDFALRPSGELPASGPVVSEASPVLAPEGVVWTGHARRSPDLQRFVDHLTACRGGDPSR